jgi:hypothetical protein
MYSGVYNILVVRGVLHLVPGLPDFLLFRRKKLEKKKLAILTQMTAFF